jgi:amidase
MRRDYATSNTLHPEAFESDGIGGDMAEELMFQPATDLAEAIRSKEVSSRELVEAAYEAIGRLNGDLNAFVTLCEERALAEADRIEASDDRPLAGVPIAIKDLGPLTEGVRTSFGMKMLGDWVPDHDSAIVRRLRGAGAIVVGKTNTPELGLLPVTEPERFGPARNPWDRSRTPGGSSGGSACAVAAGMVPLAHGNDGGGSIRIPASCCGLVGLKPARGRVSMAPDAAELVGGLAIDGVLSRTVADTAVSLDLLAGYETGDPYWAPAPSAAFAEAPGRDPGKLRIGWTAEAPNRVPVHPDCEAAAREAAALLESLGHEVEEAAPDWFDENYVPFFVTLWAAACAAQVQEIGLLMGGKRLERLEPLTRELHDEGYKISAPDLIVTLDYMRGLSRRIVAFWDDYDVLVTPTLAQPPLEIGALQPDSGEPTTRMLEKAGDFVPFTPAFNVTGQPAISLPLHQSAEGLPIGVQLVGPPIGEELLLSLAARIEEARPWADRRPELAVA